MAIPEQPTELSTTAAADEAPRFDLAFEAPVGRLLRVSPLVRRLVAPNPGPFTFTGTCTYVVGEGEVAVIDPGPDLPAHVAALFEGLKGETIASISSPTPIATIRPPRGCFSRPPARKSSAARRIFRRATWPWRNQQARRLQRPRPSPGPGTG